MGKLIKCLGMVFCWKFAFSLSLRIHKQKVVANSVLVVNCLKDFAFCIELCFCCCYQLSRPPQFNFLWFHCRSMIASTMQNHILLTFQLEKHQSIFTKSICCNNKFVPLRFLSHFIPSSSGFSQYCGNFENIIFIFGQKRVS